MNPPSKFLPLSSLPRSISQIDPALTQQPSPQDTLPASSLPSHDPSTSSVAAAAEEEVVEQAEQGGQEPEDPSEDPSTDPPPLPPNFTPYFTLLSTTSHSSSNRTTNHTSTTTHHPTVRYIFADDPIDASPVADAALELLDPSDEDEDEDDEDENEDDEGEDAVRDGSGRRKDRNRRQRRRREERYVLVEMDSSGTKVSCAKSLSPDWAVTGAEIGMAPTWDGDGAAAGGGSEAGNGAGGGGWMLRVEGVEGFDEGEGDNRRGREGEEERGLEELAEEYERRMGELRRVIGAGSDVGAGG